MLHSRTRRLSALGACLLAGMAVRASAEDGTWVQVAPPVGPSLGGSAPTASVGEAFDAKPIAVRRDSDVALDAAFDGGAAPLGAEPGLLPGELGPEDLQFSETEPAVQVWAQPIAFQPGAGAPPAPPAADPTVSGLLDDGSARPADALAAPALVYSEGPTGSWYGEVGAMFLQRTGADPRVVSYDVVTNVPALNTGDFSFAYQTLPRIVLGYQSNNGNRLETVFYGISKWNDRLSATAAAQDQLVIPYAAAANQIPVTAAGDVHTLSYTSQFINVESNIHTRLSRRRNWLIGLRYIHLNEDLDLVNNSGVFGGFPVAETYNVYTSNNVLMAQLGGEISSDEYWNRLTFTASGKAGIGMNFLQQNSMISEPLFGVVAADAGADDVAISSLIDLSLAANIDIHRNVDLKLGYHMLFLSGVALAPDQLDFSTSPTFSQRGLNEKGSVVMQGPSASLLFRW